MSSSSTLFSFASNKKLFVGSILSFGLLTCFLFYLELRKHKRSKKPIGFAKCQSRKQWKNERKIEIPPRKDMVKDRFHPTKTVLPTNIDYIVIGSGISGLSCAGYLSRMGYKVLVLEQHDRLGGCLHQFSKKFQFDTGIHYVGNVHKYKRWLAPITKQEIHFEMLGDANNDYTYDKYMYFTKHAVKVFQAKANQRMQDIYKEYEHDLEATQKIKLMEHKYFKDAKMVFLFVFLSRILRNRFVAKLIVRLCAWKYAHLWNKSISAVMHDLFPDHSHGLLKLNLMGNIGDMGGYQSTLPAILAFGLLTHYFRGGFYIRGGSQQITRSIIPVIEDNGGRCLANCNVQQILFENKSTTKQQKTGKQKAIGVVFNYGRQDDRNQRIDRSKEITVLCNCGVISGAGFKNTFESLISKAQQRQIFPKSHCLQIQRTLNLLPASVQHLHIFIGFNRNKHDLQLPSFNSWVYQTNVDSFEELKRNWSYDAFLREFHSNPLSAPIMCFLSFPCAKDSEYENHEYRKNRANCVILTEVPNYHFKEWTHHKHDRRGKAYTGLKEQIADRLMEEVLFKQYPQTRDAIEKVEIGTSLSAAYYLGSPNGESYGLHPSLPRFFDFEIGRVLTPRQPCRGLYLCGQDITTPGWASALHSGIFCAESILGYHKFSALISGRSLVKDFNKMDGGRVQQAHESIAKSK